MDTQGDRTHGGRSQQERSGVPPDDFDRDLHPDRMAGQNAGGRDRGEFRAMGDMVAGSENAYVPKDQVAYPTWNRLRGVENPERL